MEAWPQLVVAKDGPTTFVYTSSSTSDVIKHLLDDDYNFELCLRKLELTEQLKVRNAKYNRNKALMVYLFSRVILNHALYSAGCSIVFEPFKALPMMYNEFGKPHLCVASGPRIEHNSSSSNELMSIIVQFNSESPVGIDISHERQDSISETRFMEQFEGIFSISEHAQLEAIQNIHERYMLFNQFWTLKEAFTKFVGCGLNVDLSTFNFDVGPKRPTPTPTPKSKLKSKAENTIVKNGENFKNLQLIWQKDISVNFQDLDSKFKTKISTDPVICQSSILKTGPSLPVFISIVSQATLEDLKVFEIDMETVLRCIIET